MILPQVQSLIDEYKKNREGFVSANHYDYAFLLTTGQLKGWLSALEEVRCHLQNESKIDMEYIHDIEETIAAIKEVLK